jgi:hypothetical protein
MKQLLRRDHHGGGAGTTQMVEERPGKSLRWMFEVRDDSTGRTTGAKEAL